MNSYVKDEESISKVESNSEYTYHRHSEEKSMIYFRCSDKNCRARALFNKVTGKFTLKNKHLRIEDHKPNSIKAITGQQMSKISSLVKGPISLDENLEDSASLICHETLNFSLKKNNAFPDSDCNLLMKFSVYDREVGEKFCEAIITKNLAINATAFSSEKKIKLLNQSESRTIIVEVQTLKLHKHQIMVLAEEYFCNAIAETFQKL